MRTFRYLASAITCAALAGCTVHQTETPALTGPSDTALSMSITTSPQSISQNGADASVVTAKVYFTDPKTGQTTAKANLPVRFDMAVDGVAQDYGTLSARSTVTDASGIARTTYTAPPSPIGGNSGTCNGVPGTCVTILGSISDSASANPTSGGNYAASATILLMPPGVILPPAGSPTAAFSFSPSPVQQGTAATFDASASTPGTGAASIATYSWSFGDGGTGTGKVLSHTFNNSATFNVTLTVTNDRGLSASATQAVSVSTVAAPSANFVFSPVAPSTGQAVVFNGDVSTAAPGHQLTTFNWNFGDGASGSGLVVSHTFALAGAYNVVLSVLDDLGQKNSKSTSVTVTAPTGGGGGGGGALTANFTFSPTSPGLNQDVFFNATASTASTGHSITTYSWDFGDGATGSGVTTTHQYTRAGTFTVTLTVKDDLNQTATGHTSVTISNTSAQIVAAFTISPTDPTHGAPGVGTAVNFDATPSTPSPGASITGYAWDFGDGSAIGSGKTVQHTFATINTFVIRLTITDSTGATATTTQNLAVK